MLCRTSCWPWAQSHKLWLLFLWAAQPPAKHLSGCTHPTSWQRSIHYAIRSILSSSKSTKIGWNFLRDESSIKAHLWWSAFSSSGDFKSLLQPAPVVAFGITSVWSLLLRCRLKARTSPGKGLIRLKIPEMASLQFLQWLRYSISYNAYASCSLLRLLRHRLVLPPAQSLLQGVQALQSSQRQLRQKLLQDFASLWAPETASATSGSRPIS